MMRHRQERKYSITINCFDIGISEVYGLIHSKCTCMYPVKRGSLDSVHVCGSQQFAQLFLGDVYGISELIWKIGVEVDTILKNTGKAFDPLFIVCQGTTTSWEVGCLIPLQQTSENLVWKQNCFFRKWKC